MSAHKAGMPLMMLFSVELIIELTLKLLVILVITAIPLTAMTDLAYSKSYRGKSYGTVEVTHVVSVYDGDTFRANITRWPDIVGHNIPIRIDGIDTPEIRGKCDSERQLARRARDVLRELLQSARSITLHNVTRGKYFRLVATVNADGVDVGKLLLTQDLARSYDGKSKRQSCGAINSYSQRCNIMTHNDKIHSRGIS